MRRHAVGLIAIVLVALAVALPYWVEESPNSQELRAACLRIGTVMVILWLAYDQLRLVPIWLWFTFPGLLLVAARRPKWLLLLIPLLAVAAILKPRAPRRRRN